MTSAEVSKGIYSVHDAELVRQNTLLTRLLLEREGKTSGIPIPDNSNFFETQSLPGNFPSFFCEC